MPPPARSVESLGQVVVRPPADRWVVRSRWTPSGAKRLVVVLSLVVGQHLLGLSGAPLNYIGGTSPGPTVVLVVRSLNGA